MQNQGDHSNTPKTPNYEQGPRLPATTHLRKDHSLAGHQYVIKAFSSKLFILLLSYSFLEP